MYVFFLFFSFISLCAASNETLLKETLLNNYYNDILPNNSVDLKIGIALRSLNSIDQIEGTITTNVWLRHWWNDNSLTWDPNKYNTSKISFHTNPELDRSIWIPDIYLYNTAEKPLDELDYSKSIVYSNGDVIWSRPGMIKSTCIFDLKYFPYDEQTCFFKLGSWVHHSEQINISIHDSEIDFYNYQKNQEWIITENMSYIEETKYKCCPEKYQSSIFKITIRRQPGYYILNIILPAFATATLLIISLLIPWDSGERISFTVTVMLSIIVFLLIISENLPKTNTKPLLSKMLVGLIFFSLFVVFFTVILGVMHNYTKKNSKTARCILRFFDKLNISCKKETKINRNDSYLNTINVLDTNRSEIKECDILATKIEYLFTSLFFMAFMIYTSIIFSERPSYT
jgi:hypothetical protein